jgi:beta-RFAP synthase
MNGGGPHIVTPSRLHFGLLAWGEDHPRQFGSVGLMIDRPGIEIGASASSTWSADGQLGDRVLAVARRVADALAHEGQTLEPFHLATERAPREHVGLGTGTQLSLAVARLLLAASGEMEPSAERLAVLTGRGGRSGIGVHGFMHGGLLVDGGRSPESKVPPLLARMELPDDWSIVVIIPPVGHGLAGFDERQAFGRLTAVPTRTVERLCRIVLLDLLPAAAERDLEDFGSALARLQEEVGRGFAPVQGGLFAHPRSEAIAAAMRGSGLVGVGQSSWGPALFGIVRKDDDRQAAISRSLRDQFGLKPEALFWSSASPTGARLFAERPVE